MNTVQSKTGDWSVTSRLQPETRLALEQACGGWPPVAPTAMEPGFPVDAENGRRVLLHSSRDPAGEAARYVEHWWQTAKARPDSLIVVFGLGGGWHLQPLLDRLADDGVLVVVDPHPELAGRCLAAPGPHPWTPKNARFFLVTNPNVECMALEFHRLLGQFSRRLEVAFFAMPAMLRAFPRAFQETSRRCVLRMRIELAERTTLYHLGESWFRNILINLPALLDSAPVDVLRNAFAKRPVAVVAAGPGLNAALPRLRELADRVVVIAVGTALKSLLAAGIDPHLTVVVDGCPDVWPQFRDLPPTRTRFVGIPQADPRIWAVFAGRALSYGSPAFDGIERWLASFGAGAAGLQTGGTVSLTAIALADFIGGDPVTVWGLDLAYTDDGTSHADHGVYHGRQENVDGLVPMPGNWGRTVRTTVQFSQYVELISNMASKRPASAGRLVNVNDGGALIDHMALCHVADIQPQDYAPCAAAVIAELETRCGTKRGSLSDAAKAYREVAGPLAEMAADADRAVAQCTKLGDTLPNTPKRRTALKQLVRLEKRLTRRGPAFSLVELGLQAATLQALTFTRDEDSGDEAAFHKSLTCSADLYRRMAAAARWVDELLLQSVTAAPAGDDLDWRPKEA